MDWVETFMVVFCGVALMLWGRHFYARPHVINRYWYDTNRLYVGISKFLGALVMFVGAMVASGIVLLKIGQLETNLGFCIPPFALLCTILFRPIRTKKRPWQETVKPKSD